MNNKQLQILCKSFKFKEDDAMPNKKAKLIESYMKWKDWPEPKFEHLYVDSNGMAINVDVDINVGDVNEEQIANPIAA